MDAASRAARGRKPFFGACIVTALFGVGHLFSFLASRFSPPPDEQYRAAADAMRSYRVAFGVASPSIMDIDRYFSLSFSILHLLIATLSLAAFRLASDGARAIHVISLVNMFFLSLMLAAALSYRIPPGVGGSGLPFALFLFAALRTRLPTPRASFP